MDSKEMDGMLSSFPVRARTPVLFSEVELSVKNADILSSFDNQFSKRNILNRPFRAWRCIVGIKSEQELQWMSEQN